MTDTPNQDTAKYLSQRQFGAHAHKYVLSPVHARGYSLGRLIELVDPQPGGRALDVATGGGHTALMLARRGTWTVASDLTLPMLHAAREHITANHPGGSVTFARLDAEQLPFAANTFDIVTCRIAPHHFPNVAQFVREMARVTRTGGVIGTVDHLVPGDPKTDRYINALERLRDPSHVWGYSRAEWEGFFVGAGTEIIHWEEYTITQYLTEWAEKMGCDGPTITRLRAMLKHAPGPVADWITPHVPDSGEATFSPRQFILVARNPGA
jgi:ubiquinone/menaquinone biosynthesis C-methylase UbiE